MISSTMSSSQKTCQSRGLLHLCQILTCSHKVGGRVQCDACEEDEMAALDAVGDFAADPTVMLEDVPRDKLERRPCTLRSFATMLWRSSPPVPCLCVQRLSSFTLALNKDRTPNYCSEHPKYTLIILFHPRTISLCHDVCDTLISRLSALAWPPF